MKLEKREIKTIGIGLIYFGMIFLSSGVGITYIILKDLNFNFLIPLIIFEYFCVFMLIKKIKSLKREYYEKKKI